MFYRNFKIYDEDSRRNGKIAEEMLLHARQMDRYHATYHNINEYEI